MITVKVELHGPLARYAPQPEEGRLLLNLSESVTIAGILQELAVPLHSVAFVAVNGVKRDFVYQVRDGDRLQVFPPVAGG